MSGLLFGLLSDRSAAHDTPPILVVGRSFIASNVIILENLLEYKSGIYTLH